jgi:hypothetical protein
LALSVDVRDERHGCEENDWGDGAVLHLTFV